VLSSHNGEYDKARDLYSKLAVKITKDKEQDAYNTNDLNKRVEDCVYGKQHQKEYANKINSVNV
jgi:hypothetical protein